MHKKFCISTVGRMDEQRVTWQAVAGWSLILAPVGQIGGWTLMRFGGNEGVEPQTTIAHSVWLIGFVLLAIACVLYGFGTQLVYLGLLVLIVQLAVLRRIGAATLALILAALVLFVGYEALDGSVRQALMPFAVLCMWLAMAPLGWRLLKPATRVAV